MSMGWAYVLPRTTLLPNIMFDGLLPSSIGSRNFDRLATARGSVAWPYAGACAIAVIYAAAVCAVDALLATPPCSEVDLGQL